MTPEEFFQFKDSVELMKKTLDHVLKVAEGSIAVDNIILRPAVSDDIKRNNIIYYLDDKDLRWHKVVDVLHPESDFKAYSDAHGCRYGLYGAYVPINARFKV